MPQATCTRCPGVTHSAALGWLSISRSTEYAAGWGSKFCWRRISLPTANTLHSRKRTYAAEGTLTHQDDLTTCNTAEGPQNACAGFAEAILGIGWSRSRLRGRLWQFHSRPKEGLWLAHCVGLLLGSVTTCREPW